MASLSQKVSGPKSPWPRSVNVIDRRNDTLNVQTRQEFLNTLDREIFRQKKNEDDMIKRTGINRTQKFLDY